MSDAVRRLPPGYETVLLARGPDATDDSSDAELPSLVAGKRVLIVENRFILAEEVADFLLSLRCEPVGPAATLAEALALIDSDAAIDAAVLDINLEDELVYPVAAKLQAAGTPFAFATGYNDRVIPPQWRHVPRLEKPYGVVSLRDTLDMLLDGRAPPQPAGDPAAPHAADARFEQARKRRERQMEEAVLHKWRSLSGD